MSWNNSDGSYFYLVIESIDDRPHSIDPSDIFGDIGLNFEFISEPSQEGFFQLRPMIHYTQYSRHKVTIYKVNEEYALLYEKHQNKILEI